MPPPVATLYSAFVWPFLFILILAVPLPALGAGDISLRVGWRPGTGLESQGAFDLRWDRDPFRLGLSLRLPWPGWDWVALLRGEVSDGISRLGLKVGFGNGGWEQTRLDLELFPKWELPPGEISLRLGIGSHFRGAGPGVAASVGGALSLRYEIAPFWADGWASFSLYPSRLLGTRSLAVGCRLPPWDISIKADFDEGWKGISVSGGYRGEGGPEVGISLHLSPDGYIRGSLSLGLRLDPLRASAKGDFDPTGLIGMSFSLTWPGDGWEISLSGRVGRGLSLEGLSLQGRFCF